VTDPDVSADDGAATGEGLGVDGDGAPAGEAPGVDGDGAGDDLGTTIADDASARAVEGLVVVCGLPGVGKTTVARRIADRTDAVVLRTDAVRKELFPEPEYTASETATVYAELLGRAGDRLADGEPVVLDATFARADFRVDARETARERGAPFRMVKVECTEAVVERRIRCREGLSDADFEVHQLFREEYDPLELDHDTVDNSGSEAVTLERVDELVDDLE